MKLWNKNDSRWILGVKNENDCAVRMKNWHLYTLTRDFFSTMELFKFTFFFFLTAAMGSILGHFVHLLAPFHLFKHIL